MPGGQGPDPAAAGGEAGRHEQGRLKWETGKSSMPDVALFEPLCRGLGISLSRGCGRAAGHGGGAPCYGRAAAGRVHQQQKAHGAPGLSDAQQRDRRAAGPESPAAAFGGALLLDLHRSRASGMRRGDLLRSGPPRERDPAQFLSCKRGPRHGPPCGRPCSATLPAPRPGSLSPPWFPSFWSPYLLSLLLGYFLLRARREGKKQGVETSA